MRNNPVTTIAAAIAIFVARRGNATSQATRYKVTSRKAK